ncbi:unnamed protein product [Ambrosiozyma monospora]|uniref:Unnamed protein product n=1 Tax=Ambrosiozyma monospora TaxID=43982 RepID=A0ACB5TAJ5_AMBMO|nr:unnamed protein product [Ambrosiozyma monospora]
MFDSQDFRKRHQKSKRCLTLLLLLTCTANPLEMLLLAINNGPLVNELKEGLNNVNMQNEIQELTGFKYHSTLDFKSASHWIYRLFQVTSTIQYDPAKFKIGQFLDDGVHLFLFPVYALLSCKII